MAERRILLIAGPTASGKTELGLRVAALLQGEIVNADSRAVYEGLDAGTAKPVRDERGLVEGIPYHLLDRVSPGESYDAGRFCAEARVLCAEILERGRLPILVGGTGLYLRAFLNGLSPLPGRDPALRARLERRAETEGREVLHERLRALDPEAAARIPPNNIQRLVRALEVIELSGRPISGIWAESGGEPLGEPFLLAAIRRDPAENRRRIEERCRRIWPEILRETEGLLRRGFSGLEPGFQSLGYREAVMLLKGRLGQAEAFESLRRRTLAYAKRQRTYLRGALRPSWIEGGDTEAMAQELVRLLEEVGREGGGRA